MNRNNNNHSNSDLSRFLLHVAEQADQLASLDEALLMLQQTFVSVFKESAAAASESTRMRDAGEESRVDLAKAIALFHTKGSVRHAHFFTDTAYHQPAALFIHELLNSLSGNSQLWFRELQMASLDACAAIIHSIGFRTTRLCVPGIVSATVRYVDRARRGKDASTVLLKALDLLQQALASALGSTEDPAWVTNAVEHLAAAMRHLLCPKTLTDNGYDAAAAARIRALLCSITSSPAMEAHTQSIFYQEVVVAFAVIDNVQHVQALTTGNSATSSVAVVAGGDHSSTPFVFPPGQSESLVYTAAANGAIRDAMSTLRGVELLHVSCFVLRHRQTRALLISHGKDTELLFTSVVRKCIRLVGTAVSEELYASTNAARSATCCIVDEFLACLAHALAEWSQEGGEEEEGESAGEALTNALLDVCDGILQDWDMYFIHAPTIYVLSRLLVWQFKPIPPHLERFYILHKDNGEDDDEDDGAEVCVYPQPADLVTTGSIEQLWSVIAAPHLWRITEDEDLCNYQQIKHRQIIAATILRVLEVIATDVMAPAVADGGEEGSRAFQRLNTLTLYLVMEKATAAGIVRDAAMSCLDAYTRASNSEDSLDFFLEMSLALVDDASRAMREPLLRPSTASVLRGCIEFIVRHLHNRNREHSALPARDGDEVTSLFHGISTSKLQSVVEQRMSMAHVVAIQRQYGNHSNNDSSSSSSNMNHVDRIADFVSCVIKIAASGCQVATREGDADGAKASLVLLRDCFDIAALLNYLCPLEASDEDRERQTASYNSRVKVLQETCRDALLAILSCCSTSSAITPYTVQSVMRGLLAQLTTQLSESWMQRKQEERVAEERAKRVARDQSRTCRSDLGANGGLEGDDDNKDEEDDDTPLPPLVAPPLPWLLLHTDHDGEGDKEEEEEEEKEQMDTADSIIVLPRSHLKTVYRVYLCFLTMLKEPMSLFTTKFSTPGSRSAMEKRELEKVRATPAFFSTLDGLSALFCMATEFLSHRMVDEVMPLALVWHERASLPRIPTNTDVRVKEAVRGFAATLAKGCDEATKGMLRDRCKGYFELPMK